MTGAVVTVKSRKVGGRSDHTGPFVDILRLLCKNKTEQNTPSDKTYTEGIKLAILIFF